MGGVGGWGGGGWGGGGGGGGGWNLRKVQQFKRDHPGQQRR